MIEAESTKKLRFAVLGHPAAHSASPAIYHAAFHELGIDAEFGIIDDANAEAAIRKAAALGYKGLAVTIPHKEKALALADSADETARAAGAANTLLFGEEIFAANTDVHGVVRALEGSGASLKSAVVTILGAGGAARAAVIAAKLGGAKSVHLAVRSARLGAALVELFSADPQMQIDVRAFGSSAMDDAVLASKILINATPVGLAGGDEIPLPAERLHGGLAVLDMIYRPAGTMLIREATARCAKAIPGTRMFLAQAAEQFRLFTGIEAPMDIMAKALREVPGCDWP